MLRFKTKNDFKNQPASNNGRIKTVPVFEYPPEGVQEKNSFQRPRQYFVTP
jgi:hypothetical protein